MDKKYLVVVALESEISRLGVPDDVAIVYSGVGKVNAALATTHAILAHRPQLVINYGTAGKINPAISGLVPVARVVQRDMIAVPLAERGVTPFSEAESDIHSGMGGVVCGTGDSFVTSRDEWLHEKAIDVVDMELYAIAHACRHHGVDWRAYKFITDDANEDSASEWSEKVSDGESLFWEQFALVRNELALGKQV